MDQNRNQQGNGWQYQNMGQAGYGQQYQNMGQAGYGQQYQNMGQAGYGQQYQNMGQAGYGQPYQDFEAQYGAMNGAMAGMMNGAAEQTTLSGVARQLNEAMAQEVIARSFLYMVAALVVTAVAAFSSRELLLKMLSSNPSMMYLLFGAELAVVLVSNAAIRKNNAVLTAILFTVYSYLTGATLGVVVMLYTGASVVAVFLVTAVTFGIMAVYGLVTQKDLSSIGSLLMMGLIGIILSSLVNALFLHSSGMEMVISWICIAVFVGLTAYDAQKIKKNVVYTDGDHVATVALAGAFELYLDFINLFLRLLRVMGRRK
ncbi:MAG: Bax inhibitor-1 family protein [Lachnospiraceae bacterium]|nr:Bax inhibitor-1 family protein [Lachnospiraceae bacterium]